MGCPGQPLRLSTAAKPANRSRRMRTESLASAFAAKRKRISDARDEWRQSRLLTVSVPYRHHEPIHPRQAAGVLQRLGSGGNAGLRGGAATMRHVSRHHTAPEGEDPSRRSIAQRALNAASGSASKGARYPFGRGGCLTPRIQPGRIFGNHRCQCSRFKASAPNAASGIHGLASTPRRPFFSH
jgi:hypothetical protein